MKRKARLVCAGLGILYLAAVTAATVYSQTGFLDRLPVAYLVKPSSEEIPFTLEEDAVAEAGKIHYLHPSEKPLPNDVIVPGQPVEIVSGLTRGRGEVLSIAGREQEGGAEVWIEVTEGEFPDGERVKIRIEGEARKHQGALPREAVQLDEETGKPCIYTVESEQGAWGERYVLKRRECGYVWPYNDDSTPYVLVNVSARNSGAPVAVRAEPDVLYDGLEVRLASWKG